MELSHSKKVSACHAVRLRLRDELCQPVYCPLPIAVVLVFRLTLSPIFPNGHEAPEHPDPTQNFQTRKETMPKSTVPSGRTGGAFTLTEVRGKVVDSIKVYQMEDALNLDIEFNDDTTLEIIARIGFRASANLLEFKGGNSTVLKNIRSAKVSRQ